jgi:hypothetical protein
VSNKRNQENQEGRRRKQDGGEKKEVPSTVREERGREEFEEERGKQSKSCAFGEGGIVTVEFFTS